MSLLVPNTRLARPAGSLQRCTASLILLPRSSRRYASKATSSKVTAKNDNVLTLGATNPLLKSYIRARGKTLGNTTRPPTVRESDVLFDDSIFDEMENESSARPDELKNLIERQTVSRPMEEARVPAKSATSAVGTLEPLPLTKRNWKTMAFTLDPEPEKRVRWERKMVIEQVRKGGRLTKEEHLRRTERQCTATSARLKTSTKKLGMLARQVAGKTVKEALIQMRFSKKRVATEVAKHLEHARDEAIVKWGMGLGKAEGSQGVPLDIQLKDGKRKRVTDRTEIYIDQAWVGRGEYEPEVEYRARGQMNVLKKPYANITFLLKEEATRVRLSEERKKKEETSKLWLHLPDRPIHQQRQYLLW